MRRMAAERPPLIFSKYICWLALFDTTSRALGGSRRTALARITGISPLRGSLRAAPIAWSRYHPGLWLDRSIIVRLLTRVGLGKPAAMRNSLPQAALWTDGHRSAPSLAVFGAVSRTGGLGASSSVASALLPEGLSSADVSRCRIFHSQGAEGRQQATDTPSAEQIGPK